MKRLRNPSIFRRERGFTLVETMIIIAIIAILAGIAIPGFSSMLRMQHVTATVNDFFAAINLARSEAIARGDRVDLVPLDSDAGWAGGWVVFIDDNGNLRPDAGERILFSHGPVPQGLEIQSDLTDSSTPYLSYNGTGRSRTNASSQAPQFGTVSFRWEEQSRKIKINFLGRPRACNPAKEPATC